MDKSKGALFYGPWCISSGYVNLQYCTKVCSFFSDRKLMKVSSDLIQLCMDDHDLAHPYGKWQFCVYIAIAFYTVSHTCCVWQCS